MARDSFIFYRSFYEAISELPKENQADTYDAIMQYALNQKEIELTGISKAIFSLVKPQLDANYKKYENGKQKKSKKEAKVKQNESKAETNVNDNENVNVNENVNDNDNDNVGDSCVDGLQEVIDFYSNNIGFLNPYGLKILESYVEDMSSELVIYAMQIAVENNKKTISYIKAILNNWTKANIKTLEEAKRENKKKVNTDKQIEQRNYTEDEFESLYAN
jgi:DnaD/phage-associated family protein